MSKDNKFNFKLYDSEKDEIVGEIGVTTTKTQKQFMKDYEEVREQWYEETYPDSLDNYIVEKLEEKGYKDVYIEMFNKNNCLDF